MVQLPDKQDAGSGRRRRSRWLVAAVGLLLIGVAVLLTWRPAQEPETGAASLELPAAAATAPPVTASSASKAPAPGGDPTSASIFDENRIVVLPTVHENLNPVAMGTVDATRAVMLRVLRSLPKVEIVEISRGEIDAAGLDLPARRTIAAIRMRVPDNRSYDAIASYFGGAIALEISNEAASASGSTDYGMIGVIVSRKGGGGASQRLPIDLSSPEALNVESFGTRLARDIYGQLFPDERLAIWEAVITDVAASEAERLEALRTLGYSALSDAAIAAAVELARSSPDPATRSEIWTLLGRMVYPDVMHPLTDALLYDADAGVRMVAAEHLYGYLPDPSVAAALEGTSIGDASADVRLQARWSLMSMRERLAYVEQSLNDRSLSDQERVAPLMLSQAYYDEELDTTLLDILGEIAAESDDSRIRIAALREFGRSGRAEYLDPLLDTLHDDPSSHVRLVAIDALRAHRDGSFLDDEQVYVDALIEVVRNDSELDVRRSAASQLRDDIDSPGVREAIELLFSADEDDARRVLYEQLLGLQPDAAAGIEGVPTILYLQ